MTLTVAWDFQLGSSSQRGPLLFGNSNRLEDAITVAKKVEGHAGQRGGRDSDKFHVGVSLECSSKSGCERCEDEVISPRSRC